jgi:hypothetical protein
MVAADPSFASMWAGYTDEASEGVWVWTDGEASTYTNWWTDEPNNREGDEHCMLMRGPGRVDGFGRWNDHTCDGTRGHVGTSICQTEASSRAGDLICTIVTESTDDDGDDIDYTFDWDVDGTAYTDTDTTTWDDDTVPADALGYDETWTCTVTPNDGDDNGGSGSDSYTTEDDGCWEASYDGSTYTFCTEPLTRVAAEADCADRDMDLVKITSDGENDFVYTQSVDVGDWGHPGPWIGLQDEDLDGTFEWNDGLAMTYTDWCPSHPISPGSRAYVHMEIASSDYPCWAANGSSSSAELQYVCE